MKHWHCVVGPDSVPEPLEDAVAEGNVDKGQIRRELAYNGAAIRTVVLQRVVWTEAPQAHRDFQIVGFLDHGSSGLTDGDSAAGRPDGDPTTRESYAFGEHCAEIG